MRKGWITGKAKLLSQLGSDLGGILLIGINQVGAERAIGFASLVVLLGFVIFFVKDPRCLSLLSGCPVIEVGSLSGVNLPS